MKIMRQAFYRYFRDNLLETVVICQALGIIAGLVLVIYGNTTLDAFPSSILIANLLGLSIKLIGALLFALFYHENRRSPLKLFFLWLSAWILGTIIGSEIGLRLGEWLFNSEFPDYMSEEYIYSLIGNLIMTLVLFILIYLYITIKQKLAAKIRENEQITEMTTQAKLVALQSKINPHFLFNTLNAMANLVYKSPEKVEQMILNLSDIYRKVLRYPDNKNIAVEDEVNLIREYLEIEKIRMGDRLDFQISVESGIERLQIPPLLIEPVVENAVIHGIGPKPEGGTVEIRISRNEHHLLVTVTDDGIGFDDQSPKSGFGLISIKERLTLTFKEGAEMKIFKRHESGVEVCLRIPYAH